MCTQSVNFLQHNEGLVINLLLKGNITHEVIVLTIKNLGHV